MARAKNNRTLIITDEDRITYSKDIIKQDDLGKLQSFVDTTINADIYETLKYLPDNFANLIIVDPPYNISKNFNGLKFNECQIRNTKIILKVGLFLFVIS